MILRVVAIFLITISQLTAVVGMNIGAVVLIRDLNASFKSEAVQLNHLSSSLNSQLRESLTVEKTEQAKLINESKEEINLVKPQTIHVFFTKPKALANGNRDMQRMYSTLTNPSKERFTQCYEDTGCFPDSMSLNYTHNFIQAEAEKYNAKQELNILLYDGINTVENIENLGNVLLEDFDTVIETEKQFEKIAKKYKSDIDFDDKVIFVHFDNSYKQNEYWDDLMGSFRSYAGYSRAFVNISQFNLARTPYFTEVFIHEMLHLFQASDKYIEGERSCADNGYGQPDKVPVYPQTKTDIMCGIVHTSKHNVSNGDLARGNIIINKFTASEIGWVF